jgi:hypothetical protein
MDFFARYNAPVFNVVYPVTVSRKKRNSKIRLILISVLVIFLLMGCVYAPASYRPRASEYVPIEMKTAADQPGQSLLQVIIVYGNSWAQHSALRLVCPDRPVVFWDPGGSYGENLPEMVRIKDLIKVNPPDLEMYVQHIWNHSSVEIEVFEWDLKPEYARELYDVLVNGTNSNHPAGRFTTTAMPMFCTIKVSDFLHRFAGKTMLVPESFFRPDNLAKVLYTQSPKRVLTFTRSKQTVYVPPTVDINPSPLAEQK